jgi:hypothetical protein
MSVNAPSNQVDYSDVLSFMREQTKMLASQKKLIDSQQTVIESQTAHIEKQDERIRQLALDCELIKESSRSIAKKIVNDEISAHMKRNEHSLKQLHNKITEMDHTNESLKAVAFVGGIVAVGCISYTLAPIVAAAALVSSVS